MQVLGFWGIWALGFARLGFTGFRAHIGHEEFVFVYGCGCGLGFRV